MHKKCKKKIDCKARLHYMFNLYSYQWRVNTLLNIVRSAETCSVNYTHFTQIYAS